MNIASPEEHDDESEYFNSWISRKRRHPDTVNWVPPVRIFRYTTIFEEAWGWDRLLPHFSVSIPMYLEYLTEFHKRNRMDYVAAAAAAGNSKPEEWPLECGAVKNDPQFDPNASLVDAAQFCLDTEKRFMLAWNNKRVSNVKHLSRMIQERAGVIISTSEEFSETAAASLVCIANEAVLATELLGRGANSTDEEIRLCNLIRHCALNFMHMKGPESAASIAAMVGVAKEARRMCKWMREKKELYVFRSYYPPDEMHLCDVIREATFKVMSHVLMNSSRGNNTYRVMYFEKKNKRPKANVETSNEKLSQASRDKQAPLDEQLPKTNVETSHEKLAQASLDEHEPVYKHEPVYEQAPLDEREKYIVELERKLSERDRELDALKFGHKKDLLGEQTNELAKASSVCDNSEAERAEH